MRSVLAAVALLLLTAVGFLLGVVLGLWAAIVWDIGVIVGILAVARQKAIAREKRERSDSSPMSESAS